MKDKLEVWIVIIVGVLSVLAGFCYHYLGNSEFRKNVKAVISWFWVKVIKELFFWSIYIPLILVTIAILHWLSVLSITNILIVYSAWITVWCIYIARGKRRVSTVASCRLGDVTSEKGNDGLLYIRYTDGDAQRELQNGEYVRRTDFSNKSYYIYFRIRDDVAKNFRGRHCIILVEFLDKENKGSFDVEYDSRDSTNPNPKYKSCEPYPYSGDNKWHLGKFNIPDPAFKQRQNGSSDFRLRICPSVSPAIPCPDLYVRKVVCISLNE